MATARLDFNIVSESEDLLNYVKERTLDKKVFILIGCLVFFKVTLLIFTYELKINFLLIV